MDRKSIRKNGFKSFRASYFKNIIVAFIVIVILDGGYLYSTKSFIEENDIDVESGLTEEINKIDEIQENSGTKLSHSYTTYEFIFNIFKNNEKIKNIQSDIRESQRGYLDKYNEGVISSMLNDITTARISYGFMNTINIFVKEHNIRAFVLSMVFTSLSVVAFFVIKDVVEVGKTRYFLEQRRYYETKIDKILFPYKVKRTKKIAWILFNKYLFQFFWSITIVGGFIKMYEYKFIPFVLAENPNISRKEAFRLSKEMTRGNKWNLFLIDLSLFWCHILGSATFNLSNLFFYNGYKECVDAESYMQARDAKIKEWTDNSADYSLIENEKLRKKYEEGYYTNLIPLLNDKYLDIPDPKEEEYPEEHYVIPKKEHRHWLKVDYKKEYSIVNYILFFFLFSFVGYVWEVLLYLIRDGVLVNRGSLYGPWLPIYGSGGVAILILLKKFREKPVKLFLATMLLCGIIEYTGGWLLETFKGLKYWDYSTYFFNIQGRVCLECLIVFGLGGCAFMYILAPICDNLLNKIKLKYRIWIAAILVGLFGFDFLYSTFNPNVGEGITSKISNNVKEKEITN